MLMERILNVASLVSLGIVSQLNSLACQSRMERASVARGRHWNVSWRGIAQHIRLQEVCSYSRLVAARIAFCSARQREQNRRTLWNMFPWCGGFVIPVQVETSVLLAASRLVVFTYLDISDEIRATAVTVLDLSIHKGSQCTCNKHCRESPSVCRLRLPPLHPATYYRQWL